MAQGAGGSGHYNMVEKMYSQNQISYDEKMALQAGRGGKLNPSVGRVANGVSDRVDRLKGLGNAIVPQVAELVGALVVEHSQN
jgi:hypothetical protein